MTQIRIESHLGVLWMLLFDFECLYDSYLDLWGA